MSPLRWRQKTISGTESESEVSQSCINLSDSMDCSLPGSFFHGFSRQEYWSSLPFSTPGDLPSPGIKPGSPAFQADTLTSEPTGTGLLPKLEQGTI